MSSPTLSVVMPNYNHSRYLPRALQALAVQSRAPDELLLLDDASTDTSVELLSAFAAQHAHARVLQNRQNRGVIASLNRLLGEARGDYIVFTAADDTLHPDFLASSMRLLSLYPKAGLCSTVTNLVDETGTVLGQAPTLMPVKTPAYLSPDTCRGVLLASESWIWGNTSIYRRDALMEAGGFRPQLGAFTDGFVVQCVALRHGACFVPEALASWRISTESYSGVVRSDFGAWAAIIDATVKEMEAIPAVFSRDLIETYIARERYRLIRQALRADLDAATFGEVLARQLGHSNRLLNLVDPLRRTRLGNFLARSITAQSLGVSHGWRARMAMASFRSRVLRRVDHAIR